MDEDETYQRLTGLSSMIQQVYLPLMESRTETRLQMEKFISISLQQAYGNVTIKVPYVPQGVSDEEICRNRSLIEEYQNTIEEWANTIKETIDREKDRQKEMILQNFARILFHMIWLKKCDKISMNTAYGEVEYWRSRSATFNTLYQQLTMPQVRKIIQIMVANETLNQDAFSLEHFNSQWANFSKLIFISNIQIKMHQIHKINMLHAQAKDFVKFLTTLERQFIMKIYDDSSFCLQYFNTTLNFINEFKIITRGELNVIEETLPSLLNGLKLIWTISRHINQNDSKMEDLLESISNEICEKVRAQIDIIQHFYYNRISVLWIKQTNKIVQQIHQKDLQDQPSSCYQHNHSRHQCPREMAAAIHDQIL